VVVDKRAGANDVAATPKWPPSRSVNRSAAASGARTDEHLPTIQNRVDAKAVTAAAAAAAVRKAEAMCAETTSAREAEGDSEETMA